MNAATPRTRLIGRRTDHTHIHASDSLCLLSTQGVPETAKLHFVELAAPQNKQAAALDKSKASIAKAHALSKSYNSLTSVLLALKQQRRKQEPNTRYVCGTQLSLLSLPYLAQTSRLKSVHDANFAALCFRWAGTNL